MTGLPDQIGKQAWRIRLKSARASLDETSRLNHGDALRQRVLSLPEMEPGTAVLAYASDRAEVPTYTLIENLLALGLVVALPVIEEKRGMSAFVIHTLKDLQPDTYGLLSPKPELRDESRLIDMPQTALIPGLGFDQITGHRLGRGAGYYDRYLARRTSCVTIGLGFDEQVVTGLPAQPHDVPMNIVVTPTRVLRFNEP